MRRAFFEHHLRNIGRWAQGCRQSPGGILCLAAAALYVVLSIALVLWTSSHALAISRLKNGTALDTVFFTRDGRPWFRLDEQRRNYPLAAISPRVREAVIAIEDHRFRYHPGVDPFALARASFRNLTSGSIVEGGSTITQQLARTLFLSNRRTFGRKFKELVLAWMIEHQLTKDQILELYLNRVYLGSSTYGVGMLAERLFGKAPNEVALGEAALMAGIIRAPSALSPWSHPRAALARRDVVLARMREEGFITAAEERAAREAPVRIRRDPAVQHAGTGYLQEYLRQQFLEEFGPDLPGGWRIQTSALPEVQHYAEQAVAHGLSQFGVPDLHAALVAIDPATGDVLAMVGGRDFRQSPFNRATQAKRQGGSAFKPFVYAAALEHGLTPITRLSGLATMAAIGREEWVPQNAHGTVVDSLTLREALAESNNRAAVKLQQEIGTSPVIRFARDVGLRDLPDVPSLALGTSTMTPLELTSAYAVFANGGSFIKPRALRRVLDQRRSVVLNTRPRLDRVLSPQSAFQMVSMLQDVLNFGTGARARSLGVTFPAGGKTGTTDDYKDAWFAGFSSSVVAAVWVGFDEPRPIADEAYAARYALPIWSDFMRRAAHLLPPRSFETPDGIQPARICRVSFQMATSRCPSYDEVFKEGDELPGVCPLHAGDAVKASRGWRGFWRAAFGWLRSGGAEPEVRIKRDNRRKRSASRDADSDSDSR